MVVEALTKEEFVTTDIPDDLVVEVVVEVEEKEVIEEEDEEREEEQAGSRGEEPRWQTRRSRSFPGAGQVALNPSVGRRASARLRQWCLSLRQEDEVVGVRNRQAPAPDRAAQDAELGQVEWAAGRRALRRP